MMSLGFGEMFGHDLPASVLVGLALINVAKVKVRASDKNFMFTRGRANDDLMSRVRLYRTTE